MRRFTTLALIAAASLAIAACSQVRRADPEAPSKQLTYRDLKEFGMSLADQMRRERAFVETVDELEATLDRKPRVQILPVNNTHDDTIDVLNGLSDDFQENFYNADKVRFVENASQIDLKMVLKLNSRQAATDDGGRVIDYWSRVRASRLVIPDNPDRDPYYKLIGSVSDSMRRVKEERAF